MADRVTVSVPIPSLDMYEARLFIHGMQVALHPELPISIQFFERVGESVVVEYPLGALLPKDGRQAARAVLHSIGRQEQPGEPQIHT